MHSKSNSILFVNSLDDSFYNRKELKNLFLKKLDLDLRTEWTPTNDLITSLYTIEDQIGRSTLLRVGNNVAKNAMIPISSSSSFESFLEDDLNSIYKLNHIKLSEGFRVEKLKNGFSVVMKDNPYPFIFNIGLLKGFAAKHNALYNFIEVEDNHLILDRVI